MDYLAINRDTYLKDSQFRQVTPDNQAIYQRAYCLCDRAGFIGIDINLWCLLGNVKNEPSEDAFFDAMKGIIERVSDKLAIVVNFVIFSKVGTRDAITPWADIYRSIFTDALERQNQGLANAYDVMMRYNRGLKIKSLDGGKKYLEPITGKDGSERAHKTKVAYERAVHVFAELGIPNEGTANYKIETDSEGTKINYTINSSIPTAVKNDVITAPVNVAVNAALSTVQITLENIDLPDQSKPLDPFRSQSEHDFELKECERVMNKDGVYFDPTDPVQIESQYKRFPKVKSCV